MTGQKKKTKQFEPAFIETLEIYRCCECGVKLGVFTPIKQKIRGSVISRPILGWCVLCAHKKGVGIL